MQSIACYLIFLLLKVVKSTYRFEYQNQSVLLEEANRSSSYILAIWHQNILASILAHLDRKYSMIISPSKDGQYAARVCELFGHEPIRGSSSKGGVKALINSIRSLKHGTPSAVAIDGPRGPLYNIKPGVFEMAKKSGVPIIPLTVTPKNFWTFKKSWDQFRFPKPFTKIIIHYGEPIYLAESTTKEEIIEYTNKLYLALISDEEKIITSFA
ncbi:lysophospholipid acyltransferase family protein [Halobacteriovorax sp.]|uniref:lysophospholipid acyltransferase family protein n=1 Tax=Halobacteriovorax sp. TaxID=2020862 RepID=UPI00356762DB